MLSFVAAQRKRSVFAVQSAASVQSQFVVMCTAKMFGGELAVVLLNAFGTPGWPTPYPGIGAPLLWDYNCFSERVNCL